MNYYNENDPYAAQWLRNLMAAGHIPKGYVDERSIKEVQSDDLREFGQVHFFAGIGGWPYALKLAGWPDDRPVWSVSCPCQPFSAAGNHKGQEDERHLWPEMHRLIRECGPAIVFGEQVSSAIKHGWLDGVYADLEAEGYAIGSIVLGAHSVGAPHIRQRLFWVADLRCEGLEEWQEQLTRHELKAIERSGDACGMADADQQQFDGGRITRAGGRIEFAGGRESSRWGAFSGRSWIDFDIVDCTDGKQRRVISGTQLVDYGFQPELAVLCPTGAFKNRRHILKGIGNAVVPPLAAEFIKAFMS